LAPGGTIFMTKKVAISVGLIGWEPVMVLPLRDGAARSSG
jgi:hypothetical protein